MRVSDEASVELFVKEETRCWINLRKTWDMTARVPLKSASVPFYAGDHQFGARLLATSSLKETTDGSPMHILNCSCFDSTHL